MIKEKNIAVSIILYFVTCGIYYLIFMADSTRDVDIITNNPEKRSGGTVVLLSILTCGIYGFYWWYKQGELMEKLNYESGKASSSSAVLYLLLSLFGLSFVNMILLQSDLNKYATQN